MESLKWYYVSRAVLTLVVSGVAWIITHSVWMTATIGALTLAAFVWYANSGHFIVDPDRPLTPLRRDEREQSITYKAATYALVAVMLLLAVAGVLGLLDGRWTSLVVFAGFVVYFVSRAWLRRAV
jgi:hypothetical protein